MSTQGEILFSHIQVLEANVRQLARDLDNVARKLGVDVIGLRRDIALDEIRASVESGHLRKTSGKPRSGDAVHAVADGNWYIGLYDNLPQQLKDAPGLDIVGLWRPTKKAD